MLAIVPALALGNALLLLMLAGGAVVVATAVLRPVWLLWASMLTLIMVPTYIRLSVVPGLPSLPVALALLGVLCAVLILGSMLGPSRPAPLGADGRQLAAALILFGVAMFLSLVDPRTSVNSVDFWIKIVVVPSMLSLAMLRLVRSTSDLHALFGVIVTASLFAAVYAVGEFASGTNVLLQYFQGQGEEREWFWEGEDFARVGAIHRTYSLFTNPIEFGGVMSMFFPYSILRVMNARGVASRTAWSVAALLLLLGVTLTFSRGPILAVLVTTVGLAAVLRPLRRTLLITAVPCVVAVVAAWPWFGDRIVERISDASNVTLRLKLWSIAAHMAADHPVLGVGLGNFPSYQLDTIRNNRIDTLGEPNALRVQTAENVYLQLAAETGVVGLIAFAMLIAATTRLVWGLHRRVPPGEARTLLYATVAALVACGVNGLTIVLYQLYVSTVLCGFAFAALLILDRIYPRGRA